MRGPGLLRSFGTMKRHLSLLMVISVLSGCGGATVDGDAPPASPASTITEGSPVTQPADTSTSTTQPGVDESPSGEGYASLTLDGEAFEFPSFTCLVGHEETATLGSVYEDQSFVGYTGLVDGVQMRVWVYDKQMQGRLTPPPDGPSIQSGWWVEVQADSVSDINWAWAASNLLAANNLSFRFDDGLVTGSGIFDYRGEDEGVPVSGTFEAECA